MDGSQQYDVAVLGAGPSGLSAAYCLGKAGARTAVLERAAQAGGLMRGVRLHGAQVDLGRKELYSRFPEVHEFWTELLGHDYRQYPHRVGSLFEGRILEKEAQFRGRMRGMSATQVARMGASYLASQLKPGFRHAKSAEDFYLMRYGRAYYNSFINGFNVKFEGRSSAELPSPEGEGAIPRFGFLRRTERSQNQDKADVLFSHQHVWRHPAKGTQQIVDRLEEEAVQNGVAFLFGSEVCRLELKDGGTYQLIYRYEGREETLTARYIVSSLPLQFLTGLLEPELPEDLRVPPREEALFKKSTALVYLFADAKPRFEHNWIEVNDPDLKMGRVVNYASWNGDMVPEGKTVLCVEFFAKEEDPILQMSKEDLHALAVKEASANGLVTPESLTGQLVVHLPKVNASTAIYDRKQAWLQAVAAHVAGLPRFFETNRPGIDRATLAGIDAAEACTKGTQMRQRSLASSSKEL